MTARPVFLAAMVPPGAAYVISRACRARIEEVAGAQPQWLRREMLTALAQMEEAGRQWAAGMKLGAQVEAVAEVVPELTTSEAAGVLGISARMVTKLITGEQLRARKVGGRWLVVEVDVLERRRRLAEAS